MLGWAEQNAPRLTCEQMQEADEERRAQTATQTRTEPHQTTKNHQTQRDQRQQELTAPQICTEMNTHTRLG